MDCPLLDKLRDCSILNYYSKQFFLALKISFNWCLLENIYAKTDMSAVGISPNNIDKLIYW